MSDEQPQPDTDDTSEPMRDTGRSLVIGVGVSLLAWGAVILILLGIGRLVHCQHADPQPQEQHP